MAAKLVDIGVHFRMTDQGYPVAVTNTQVLADSIETILKTSPGERVHRPTFGSGLKRLIFSNMDRATAQRARVEARLAIESQEDRVVVDEILFSLEDNGVLLSVIWRPVGPMSDARQTTLVRFPTG